MSHPVWVRGLKQSLCRRKRYHLHVAPRVGAWIETLPDLNRLHHALVAPRVGAWIETLSLAKATKAGTSHPVWVRGLKLYLSLDLPVPSGRTPCGCVD